MAKKIREKYYRKHVDFFRLVEKIKLWPSRKGILHGIKTFESRGIQATITTHCRRTFSIQYSHRGRAARWLRNKWFFSLCHRCRIPEWKIEKYAKTHFHQHRGSLLRKEGE